MGKRPAPRIVAPVERLRQRRANPLVVYKIVYADRKEEQFKLPDDGLFQMWKKYQQQPVSGQEVGFYESKDGKYKKGVNFELVMSMEVRPETDLSKFF
jgi:hypothetical protein